MRRLLLLALKLIPCPCGCTDRRGRCGYDAPHEPHPRYEVGAWPRWCKGVK